MFRSRLGISASLNVGLRAAKGEYIARMDADDLSLPERFEVQVKYMDDNPHIAVCGSDIICINSEGRRLFSNDGFPEYPEQIKSDLLFYCVVRHPTVIIRKKSVYENNLFYNEEFCSSEDYELWCRAVHSIGISKIPSILLKYRWHNNNGTHANYEESIKNCINVLNSNLNRLQLHPSEAELKYLCQLTCKENIKNFKIIEKILNNFYVLILDKNRELNIYDEACLKNTLDKRMYWKRHPFRRIAVIIIKSIAGVTQMKQLDLLAIHLEMRGFVSALKRTLSRIAAKKF